MGTVERKSREPGPARDQEAKDAQNPSGQESISPRRQVSRPPTAIVHGCRLLDAARKSNPDRPQGCSFHGAARVTYYRAAGHRQYEVATDAVCIIVGSRSVVLPYVDALLAGCVTREMCDAWIAKRTTPTVT